jgi:hypothetical protein
MQLRKPDAAAVAAMKAGFSPSTAYRRENDRVFPHKGKRHAAADGQIRARMSGIARSCPPDGSDRRIRPNGVSEELRQRASGAEPSARRTLKPRRASRLTCCFVLSES